MRAFVVHHALATHWQRGGWPMPRPIPGPAMRHNARRAHASSSWAPAWGGKRRRGEDVPLVLLVVLLEVLLLVMQPSCWPRGRCVPAPCRPARKSAPSHQARPPPLAILGSLGSLPCSANLYQLFQLSRLGCRLRSLSHAPKHAPRPLPSGCTRPCQCCCGSHKCHCAVTCACVPWAWVDAATFASMPR